MQKIAEFERLLSIVSDLSPKIILEIGVGKGGTSWAWSKIPSLTDLICVDLPNGPWGGGPAKEAMEYIANNSQCKLTFIAGNSSNSASLAHVKDTLGDRKIDFLSIDGAHDYAGVKTDFLTYSPLVRPQGIVAFHDILKHAPETGCEVEKFWTELKETLPIDRYSELVQEPTNWGGWGVVKV